MRKASVLFIFLVSFGFLSAQWQSSLVQQNADGSLIYNADADGFIVPDFSHAGYMGGGVEIPDVAVVKTISPINGDNTAHIQAAIDEVGKKQKDANGFRGALMLSAGKYTVSGTLQVKYDGVVIRGVGQGEDANKNTIIYALKNETKLPQRDVIVMGNTSRVWGNSQVSGTKTNITDAVVPVGAYTFSVENIGSYVIGDHIIIYHPCTQAWVNAVDKGGVPYPDPSAPTDGDERWTKDQLPIIYNRYITHIEGNTITVDAPFFLYLR